MNNTNVELKLPIQQAQRETNFSFPLLPFFWVQFGLIVSIPSVGKGLLKFSEIQPNG
jgi:hypothetical protein